MNCLSPILLCIHLIVSSHMGYKLGSPRNSRVEGTVGIWKLQYTQYSISPKMFLTNLLQQGHHTKHTSQFAHSNVDDIEEVFNSSWKPLLFRSQVSFGHRNTGVLPSMAKKHVSVITCISSSFRGESRVFLPMSRIHSGTHQRWGEVFMEGEGWRGE